MQALGYPVRFVFEEKFRRGQKQIQRLLKRVLRCSSRKLAKRLYHAITTFSESLQSSVVALLHNECKTIETTSRLRSPISRSLADRFLYGEIVIPIVVFFTIQLIQGIIVVTYVNLYSGAFTPGLAHT